MKFIINYSYVRSNLYLVISGKEKAGIITTNHLPNCCLPKITAMLLLMEGKLLCELIADKKKYQMSHQLINTTYILY